MPTKCMGYIHMRVMSEHELPAKRPRGLPFNALKVIQTVTVITAHVRSAEETAAAAAAACSTP